MTAKWSVRGDDVDLIDPDDPGLQPIGNSFCLTQILAPDRSA